MNLIGWEFTQLFFDGSSKTWFCLRLTLSPFQAHRIELMNSLCPATFSSLWICHLFLLFWLIWLDTMFSRFGTSANILWFIYSLIWPLAHAIVPRGNRLYNCPHIVGVTLTKHSVTIRWLDCSKGFWWIVEIFCHGLMHFFPVVFHVSFNIVYNTIHWWFWLCSVYSSGTVVCGVWRERVTPLMVIDVNQLK